MIELFEIVVPCVRAGERESIVRFNCEVKLGGQLKVDEVTALRIAYEEVKLADCGMNIGLDLEVFGEYFKVR